MENKTLKRNFEGYSNTPLLWQGADIFNLQQLDCMQAKFQNFKPKGSGHLRLGKLVEQFVFYQLEQDPNCEILLENIQIQVNKHTIGELDALLKYRAQLIHLEIVYKFYLYDPEACTTEFTHWIGPNRKDNLIQKLNKLKEKQLPLLYHPKTQLLLDGFGLLSSEVEQQVHFKAQLFLPFVHHNPIFYQINPHCIKGFYLKITELEQFKTGQFFIPEKVDWLMECHEYVKWMDYGPFLIEVSNWLHKKMSPLCWLKYQGIYSKIFVVWW